MTTPPDPLPPLTEAELQSLEADASTPTAKASAQRAFRRQAPAAQKTLLDATDADTEGS